MVARGVNKGFTIIEVTLFLAVTGLLFTMLLAGAGVAVSRERYNDSVSNLQDMLKEQYSRVANTQNDHEKARCDAGSEGGNTIVVPTIDSGGNDYGRSQDCVVLGRLIIFNDNQAANITTYNVIAKNDKNLQDKKNIQAALSFLAISRDLNSEEPANLTWSAVARLPQGKSFSEPDGNNAVLIVRSPLSDSIVTFIGHANLQTGDVSLISLANVNNIRNNLSLCVDSSSRTFANMRAVYISSFGSGPSAVALQPLDTSDSTTSVPKAEC